MCYQTEVWFSECEHMYWKRIRLCMHGKRSFVIWAGTQICSFRQFAVRVTVWEASTVAIDRRLVTGDSRSIRAPARDCPDMGRVSDVRSSRIGTSTTSGFRCRNMTRPLRSLRPRVMRNCELLEVSSAMLGLRDLT